MAVATAISRAMDEYEAEPVALGVGEGGGVEDGEHVSEIAAEQPEEEQTELYHVGEEGPDAEVPTAAASSMDQVVISEERIASLLEYTTDKLLLALRRRVVP